MRLKFYISLYFSPYLIPFPFDFSDFSILERRRRREGQEKERERRRRKKKISGVIESLDVFRIKILKYSFRGIKASKLLRFASFIQGFSANIFFSSFFLRFLRPTARSKCFVSDIPLSSFSLAKTYEITSPRFTSSKQHSNNKISLPFHFYPPNLTRCERSDFSTRGTGGGGGGGGFDSLRFCFSQMFSHPTRCSQRKGGERAP